MWLVADSNPTCGQASLQAVGIQPHGDKEDVWAFNSSSALQPRQSPRRNVRFEGNQQHISDTTHQTVQVELDVCIHVYIHMFMYINKYKCLHNSIYT